MANIGLRERVQALIDQYHDGSVNRAATDIGVKQPTLFRLLSGDSASPRLDLITRIAEHYRVPVDFLITGQGRTQTPQKDPIEEAETQIACRLRWEALLREIGLSPAAAEKWTRLPGEPISQAFLQLLNLSLVYPSTELPAARVRDFLWLNTLVAAQVSACQAWVLVISHLAKLFGAKNMCGRMESLASVAQLGFNQTAQLLAKAAPKEAKKLGLEFSEPMTHALGQLDERDIVLSDAELEELATPRRPRGGPPGPRDRAVPSAQTPKRRKPGRKR